MQTTGQSAKFIHALKGKRLWRFGESEAEAKAGQIETPVQF
jgi:hypothetical protein